MNPYYALASERAGHRCEYCHAPEVIFNILLEVEHVIPKARQGLDEDSNIALACRSCNAHKRDQVGAMDEVDGMFTELFHPRRHVWTEHFQVDTETGTIRGKTGIGRVTVACLEVNSPS
jgi:hypothetical protein